MAKAAESGQSGTGKTAAATQLAGIRSVEQIQTDIERELDRTIFCT